MELVEIFFLLLLYVFPMYFSNGAPLVLHGKVPLDFGKKLFGKRILGDGKTILGAFSGILIGTAGGAMAFFLIPYAAQIPNYFSFIVFLSIGAILGDIIKSFIKRRLGFERGAQWVLADQLDFIFGGLILSSLIRLPEIEIVLLLLVITLFMHSATNFIAYKIKLKNVPW